MKPMRRKSREIEMLSDLKHANIVRLFNSQIHSDFVVLHEEYLTMPYWIRSDPGQTFSFTCAFMLDGIAALRELAKHRIIHRDISPSNVRWSRLANTWKLTDFDMAVFADENGVYRSDRVVGTEGFIAPEVLEGEPYSYSSDFCSLGKVALEEIFRPGTVRFGHEANRKIHQIIHLQLLRTDASPMNRKDPEFVEHALLEIYGVLIVVYRKLGLKWVKNKYDDLAALIAFKVYEEIAVEEQETHEAFKLIVISLFMISMYRIRHMKA
jgi:serine/threonine protein kinase